MAQASAASDLSQLTGMVNSLARGVSDVTERHNANLDSLVELHQSVENNLAGFRQELRRTATAASSSPSGSGCQQSWQLPQVPQNMQHMQQLNKVDEVSPGFEVGGLPQEPSPLQPTRPTARRPGTADKTRQSTPRRAPLMNEEMVQNGTVRQGLPRRMVSSSLSGETTPSTSSWTPCSGPSFNRQISPTGPLDWPWQAALSRGSGSALPAGSSSSPTSAATKQQDGGAGSHEEHHAPNAFPWQTR